MMADRKRFKQHRDFKEHLEDDPRERFTRKKDREDYRKENKRGDFRKSFDKKKGNNKYGKKRYDDED